MKKGLFAIFLILIGIQNILPQQMNLRYFDEPEGRYEERRTEFLQYSAERSLEIGDSEGSKLFAVWGQVSRLEMGLPVQEEVIREAIKIIDTGRDINDFAMGGLIRIMYKYGDSDLLPGDLKERIKQCILDFKYWWRGPGDEPRAYHTENHQIIFHSCELLAGQLYPNEQFNAFEQEGTAHVIEGLDKVRKWMEWRVRFGFSEWLSNTYYLEDLMALANLSDFARQPDVRKKATMLMDMIAIEMAVNPRLDFHALGEVHIQTLRHNHYMLSSAQDYRPGMNGYQQHIWQATLGNGVLVYTNHPATGDLSSRPNFWTGNGVLPRVAQYKNVLCAIHVIPADYQHPTKEEKFFYSHAYFPAEAFDEVKEQGQWIFGRKNKAYLALYSQHPYRWNTNEGVCNEIRVENPRNIWLCEMGSEYEWDSFQAFMQGVGSASVDMEGLEVVYDSPTIGTMCFGWEGPLKISGKKMEMHNYGRFDNPYCRAAFPSKTLHIAHNGKSLFLDFENQVRKRWASTIKEH